MMVMAGCPSFKELILAGEYESPNIEFCYSGRVELTTTSKLLNSSYFRIKVNCSLKALKFKHLKYTGHGESTVKGHHLGSSVM